MENATSTDYSRTKAAVTQLNTDTRNGAALLKDTATTEAFTFAKNVKAVASTVRDDANPDLIRLRDRVQDVLATASATISDGAAKVKTTARQVASTTDTYVRENPYKTAGISLLAGALFGLLAARRK